MIRIGLTDEQKRNEIQKYVKEKPVKSVIVFSPAKFEMGLPVLGDVPIRQIEYNEVIMYRTFYPLLEEIGDGHLLVVNEFMRTANRNDLTYNCLRHYLNQCGHVIVFEYFPFISAPVDFMIPLDFATNSKHKGFGFEDGMLKGEDIQCVNHHIVLRVEHIELPDEAEKQYEEKKAALFDGLGNRSPDIVPRELHVFCGRYKKPFIRPDTQYVARNARFKLPNVITYPKVQKGEQYTLLDFQHRRMDMNDFLRRTEQNEIVFLSTDLSVDKYYVNAFNAWLEELEGFYAKAGIYAGNS